MIFQTLRRVLALALLCVSLGLLAWSLWPSKIQMRSLVIDKGDVQFPEGAEEQTAQATFPEGRRVTLEYPERVWVGDVASIVLEVGLDGQGGDSPAGASPNLNDAHFIRAEARLEMTGLSYTPVGEISQPLLPGLPAVFTWRLRADQARLYPGSVWLYLRFLPRPVGPGGRQVITVQRIEIQALEFLGLSGPWLRALSSAGLAVGIVFSLEGLAFQFWRQQSGKSRPHHPG